MTGYRPDHPEKSCASCGHNSDCATHNEPAMPAGPCNCSKLPGTREALATVYYCPEHGDFLPVDGAPDTRSVRCSYAHTPAQVRSMVRPRGTDPC